MLEILQPRWCNHGYICKYYISNSLEQYSAGYLYRLSANYKKLQLVCRPRISLSSDFQSLHSSDYNLKEASYPPKLSREHSYLNWLFFSSKCHERTTSPIRDNHLFKKLLGTSVCWKSIIISHPQSPLPVPLIASVPLKRN